MFSRFTRAKADISIMNTVLPEAERLARQEGRSAPGAEHLIEASLSLPDGTGTRILHHFGVDSGRFHAAVAESHGAALDAIGVAVDSAAIDAALPGDPGPARGIYHSDPSAQALFQRVISMAKADQAPLLGAYFLLAAAELEHGTVARALARLDIDRRDLAAFARRELDLHAAQGDERARPKD